jgi:hypothetical protein
MLSAVPLAVKTVTSCVNEDAVLDLALDETRHICIRVLGLENDREGQPGLDVALYLISAPAVQTRERVVSRSKRCA